MKPLLPRPKRSPESLHYRKPSINNESTKSEPRRQPNGTARGCRIQIYSLKYLEGSLEFVILQNRPSQHGYSINRVLTSCDFSNLLICPEYDISTNPPALPLPQIFGEAEAEAGPCRITTLRVRKTQSER